MKLLVNRSPLGITLGKTAPGLGNQSLPGRPGGVRRSRSRGQRHRQIPPLHEPQLGPRFRRRRRRATRVGRQLRPRRQRHLTDATRRGSLSLLRRRRRQCHQFRCRSRVKIISQNDIAIGFFTVDITIILCPLHQPHDHKKRILCSPKFKIIQIIFNQIHQ